MKIRMNVAIMMKKKSWPDHFHQGNNFKVIVFRDYPVKKSSTES